MTKNKEEVKNVSQLEKWEKNPRKITAEKARILLKTLKEFGDLGGIVFNKKNQKLVSGHQRSDALAQGEIIYTEKYPKPNEVGTCAIGYIIFGDEKFSYREVFWDEKKHAAAALAANKSAGEWDVFKLKDVILDLDDPAFDFELTGFPQIEVENILNAFKNYEPVSSGESVTNDVLSEYEGMPEYEHEDDSPYHKIIVKFANEDDYKKFCEILEIDITTNTKTTWYPQRESRNLNDFAYKIKEEDEASY